MLVDANDLLLGLCDSLDYVQNVLFPDSKGHSKRVAYISLAIAKKLKLSDMELFDLATIALLHDNGVASSEFIEQIPEEGIFYRSNRFFKLVEENPKHQSCGENNIKEYPFLTTKCKNVIKYHHENYNGTGTYGIKGDKIPLFAQIIRLADLIDWEFELEKLIKEPEIKSIIEYIEKNINILFSEELARIMAIIAKDKSFWIEVKSNNVVKNIKKLMPNMKHDMSYQKLREITKGFSSIIDGRNEGKHSQNLSKHIEVMGRFYGKSEEEIFKMMIASDLHDLGKLAIRSRIPRGMSIQASVHSGYTRMFLSEIKGLEEIVGLSTIPHEEVIHIKNENLFKSASFEERLLVAVDVFEGLRESVPNYIDEYKKLIKEGKVDSDIGNNILFLNR